MGGGDLNLKKSWHPNTMKNQERLWKAEQSQKKEDDKLKDLKREIETERDREDLTRIGQTSGVLLNGDNKKLEWMYQSSTHLINREEYLLGRSIDKSFELLQEEEKKELTLGVRVPVNHVEHECIPFSIRSYSQVESKEQVDLQRKVLEDPLMAIRQREMDSRRKLLENPVKLKELHRILKTEKHLKKIKEKEKKSKKSKHKKAKKKSKRKKRKSSSSDSSSNSDSTAKSKDLDIELEERYKKLLNQKDELPGFNLAKLLDARYETISKELDKAVNSRKEKKRSSKKNAEKVNEEEKNSGRERDRSSRGKTTHRSRSRSPIRHRNRFDTFSSRGRQKAEYSRSERDNNVPSSSRQTSSSKLSKEEKEKRLKEMQANAVWRDEDRTRSVQKYREEYAREEEENRSTDFDKNFINKEVRKAISKHTSVGSRIHSNRNNIQRGSTNMNSSFVKK